MRHEMWIEETETKLAAYVQDTFVFADLIMALTGASMLKGIRGLDTTKLAEFLPFAATVIAAAFLGNIALGVALGCVAYAICKAAGKDRGGADRSVHRPGRGDAGFHHYDASVI